MDEALRAARAALRADLLAFVAAPAADRFDALAARVVAYQAAAVEPYGRLVFAAGGTPTRWQDAPLVPTELFRDVDLTADPVPGEPEAVFRTSGTTGAGRRGERRVPDLGLYQAAMEAPFVAAVLGGDRAPRPWLALLPPAEVLPDSSLSHMVTALAADLARATTWAMDASGLDLPAARAALEALAAAPGPSLVLTTSFALVQLLDGAPDLRVGLPAGSRMMLTGGFKGRARELSEPDLLAAIEERLGLAADAVVPEYGMTELSSQAYGRPLVAPPWLRLRVVDPVTQADLPPGTEGLVAFFDLLNLDNVSAILTADRGILDPSGGLTLLGRAPGAIPRGCSLTAEELGAKP